MANKNKGWLKLGQLIRNETDREGNPIAKADQKTYLKLSDDAHAALTAAGFNVGKNGVLVTPVDEVENLIKAGQIPEDKVEERRAAATQVSSWLRFNIQVPPPRA